MILGSDTYQQYEITHVILFCKCLRSKNIKYSRSLNIKAKISVSENMTKYLSNERITHYR